MVKGIRCLVRYFTTTNDKIARSTASNVRAGGIRPDGRTLRFYKEIDVHRLPSSSYCTIHLDGKVLQTPKQKVLIMPTEALALAVATEWQMQEKLIRPTSMPLTTLVTTVVDMWLDEEQKEKLYASTRRYLGMDALCWRDPLTTALGQAQQAKWDPILEWLQTEHDIKLQSTTSIIGKPLHSEQEIEKYYQILRKLDPWVISAVATAASDARSYSLGLALVQKALSVEQALEAARLEELHQIGEWGRVEGAHDIDEAYLEMKFRAVDAYIDLLQME